MARPLAPNTTGPPRKIGVGEGDHPMAESNSRRGTHPSLLVCVRNSRGTMPNPTADGEWPAESSAGPLKVAIERISARDQPDLAGLVDSGEFAAFQAELRERIGDAERSRLGGPPP